MLGSQVFERLCRDLWEEEPGIRMCEVYGRRGQSQRGIDLLAHRVSGDALQVGQCKAYEHFPPGEFKKATEEFQRNRRHWAARKVEKFVLFVACDLDDAHQQEAILSEKRRFKRWGVTYEVWSGATIKGKLRPHSAIVAEYLKGQDWIKVICGDATLPPAAAPEPDAVAAVVVSRAIVSENQLLLATVVEQVQQRIGDLQQQWLSGQREKVVASLELITRDQVWCTLPNELQSRILRFKARVVLATTHDATLAREIALEAQALDPTADRTSLNALICYGESGADAALGVLEGRADRESQNLRAALLLEKGLPVDALSAADTGASQAQPDAETYRIRALARLVLKELPIARLEIQKALELEPHAESAHFACAIVKYFSSLSLTAVPDHLAAWPNPVDLLWVKQDAESCSFLRDAASVFRKQAEAAKDPRERRNLEGWHLACLANDADHEAEAADYCRQLIEEDGTHCPAIAWAIARGFEIDLTQSMDAFSAIVGRGEASMTDVLVLVSLHLQGQEPAMARSLLEGSKALFQGRRAEALWVEWYARALVTEGDPRAALDLISQSEAGVGLHHARALALRALPETAAAPEILQDFLESTYFSSGDPAFLYQSCALRANRADWTWVAERAETLVKSVGTPGALRLGAVAAFNSGRYDLCTSLLDTYRHLLPGDRHRGVFRRLRAQCLRSLGLLSQALTDAEMAAQEDPSVDNLMTLARLYAEKGDLRSTANVARRILGHADLTAKAALALAQLVQWEERAIAVELWKTANQMGVEDDEVVASIKLGYQLGLDEEMRPLFSRLSDLRSRGHGDIFAGSLDELKEVFRRQRDQVSRLAGLYSRGEIPVHMLAEQMKLPLARLYHLQLKENETRPNPRTQPALLARHGGRRLPCEFGQPPFQRLYLDLTSSLLAAHLGMLDAVERVFAPLRIAQALIPTLINERDHLGPSQPSRVGPCQEILSLIERGTLQTVGEKCAPDGVEPKRFEQELDGERLLLYGQAEIDDARVIDFLPPSQLSHGEFSEAAKARISRYGLNCRSLVEALRVHGPLSEKAYYEALAALGSEGERPPEGSLPELGSRLLCVGGIAELLAQSGLLGIACDRFRVVIRVGEMNQVRSLLQENETQMEATRWLGELVDRLSRGIDTGVYLVIPTARASDEGVQGDDLRHGMYFDCLESVITCVHESGDALWVDDRYLNRHYAAENASIVGVSEVLRALVSAGALDRPQYFALLLRLRCANVRWIPLEAEEICFHLGQARVDNGRVVETQELAAVRRYVAACILHGQTLEHPSRTGTQPVNPGEGGFLLGIGDAVCAALSHVWASAGDHVVSQAQAEWILNNLYLDHLSVFAAASFPRASLDETTMMALTLGNLLARPLTWDPQAPGGIPRDCGPYLEWLFHALLSRRLDATPQLVPALSLVIRNTLVSIVRDVPAGMRGRVTSHLQSFYGKLPKPIRDRLWHETDFMERIGLKPMVSVSTDGLDFDPDDFWRAAAEALNGREAALADVTNGQKVILHPFVGTDGRRTIQLSTAANGKTMFAKDDDLELLLESVAGREAFLRGRQYWFDCSAPESEDAIARIATTENHRERIEQARLWRQSSAAEYYRALRSRLTRLHELRFSDLMPPNRIGLLRHYRLCMEVGSGPAFRRAFEDAARALMEDEGVGTAFQRLMSIPVPLPSVLFSEIDPWSTERKRALVKQLLREGMSPVYRFHLLRLLVRLEKEIPSVRRLARRILNDWLVLGVDDSLRASVALFGWVYDEFCRWHDASPWPAHLRLAMAWAHAQRLQALFASTGISSSWVRERFDQIAGPMSTETFDPNLACQTDVSHPSQVDPLRLLVEGVAYALEDLDEPTLRGVVQRHLPKLLYSDVGGSSVPALTLLRDQTGANNSLTSFLGGDRGKRIQPLVGLELADAFTSESLESLLRQCLDRIESETPPPPSWAMVYMILGDLPASIDLDRRIAAAISKVDFVREFSDDAVWAAMAIRSASIRARFTQDESVRSHLRNVLVRMAKSYGDGVLAPKSRTGEAGSPSTIDEQCRLELLEAARALSIGWESGEEGVKYLGSLWEDLVDTCPLLSPLLRNLSERACNELPTKYATLLSRLLVRLRAE